MHIETLLRQKQRDFYQNVPDISYLDWTCLGNWFPIPALCGGLSNSYKFPMVIHFSLTIIATRPHGIEKSVKQYLDVMSYF